MPINTSTHRLQRSLQSHATQACLPELEMIHEWEREVSQISESLAALTQGVQDLGEVSAGIALFNQLLDASEANCLSADQIRSLLMPLQIKLEAGVEQVRNAL